MSKRPGSLAVITAIPGAGPARPLEEQGTPPARPAQHSAMPYRIPKSMWIADTIRGRVAGLRTAVPLENRLGSPAGCAGASREPLILFARLSNLSETEMIESINGATPR